MWRKVLFSVVTIAATFSIAYAYCNDNLRAATASFGQYKLSVGNKVYLISNNNQPLVWDVLSETSDSYVLMTSQTQANIIRCGANTASNSLYASSSNHHVRYCDYTTTEEYNWFTNINKTLSAEEL